MQAYFFFFVTMQKGKKREQKKTTQKGKQAYLKFQILTYLLTVFLNYKLFKILDETSLVY